MELKDADFVGRQTIGHFFKTVMEKLAENESTSVEMEMDIAGSVVAFEITILDIRKQDAARSALHSAQPGKEETS